MPAVIDADILVTNRGLPVPQYVNSDETGFEMWKGEGGAGRVLLYDAQGNPLLTAASPGNVKVVNQDAEAIPTKLTGSLPAGTALLGKAKITDGSNDVGVTSDGKLKVDASVSATITGTGDEIVAAPSVGTKTVTTTAAEIFAAASAKTGRRMMIIKNEDPVLRFRIGPSSVTQQTGFPVESGTVITFKFDPTIMVPIYVISEGVNINVAVMEA